MLDTSSRAYEFPSLRAETMNRSLRQEVNPALQAAGPARGVRLHSLTHARTWSRSLESAEMTEDERLRSGGDMHARHDEGTARRGKEGSSRPGGEEIVGSRVLPLACPLAQV